MANKCANCGSTTAESGGWIKSGGNYYCSSGCQHNHSTLAKHKGKSGILSGLSQITDGALGGSGLSADNIVGGAGNMALGIGKLIFGKKK